jgi:hypothetical protein
MTPLKYRGILREIMFTTDYKCVENFVFKNNSIVSNSLLQDKRSFNKIQHFLQPLIKQVMIELYTQLSHGLYYINSNVQ